MRILYIADVKNWCFDKMGRALQRYGKNKYQIRYGRPKYRGVFKGTENYDLIVFAVDVRIDVIVRKKPPRCKTIVLIRSDVFKTCRKKMVKYYKESKLLKAHVGAFMIANNQLLERFKKKYDMPCFYAPGGVETKIFKPLETPVFKMPPTIGWAGSRKNFSRAYRGIDIIEEACKKLGYKWNPAYRENKWRTQQEMVDYYHNDIDIFIDLWKYAGRQNGLLEAGACGLPLVSCDSGIARELSESGGTIITNRDISSVCKALEKAANNMAEYGKLNAEFIKNNWSWEKHVAEWEKIFEKVKHGT